MKRRASIGVLCVWLLCGCGAQAGQECHFTGSGFSLRDPCRSRCLELSTIHCPDGSAVSPARCAGVSGCIPGSCPDGQACHSFQDPFDEVAYCVPVDVCPDPPATSVELRAWESSTRQRASELREQFGKLKRSTKPTPEPGEP